MRQIVELVGDFSYRNLVCLSFNAAMALPCLDSVLAFIESVERSQALWNVIFISEVDGKLEHLPKRAFCKVDGHLVLRHWPGHGSHAMMFIVHRNLVHAYRDCIWKGRAGGLRLYSRGLSSSPNINLVIIGVHGAHGDQLPISLMHASTVIRTLRCKQSSSAQVIALGDWNVDLLPSMACDHWFDVPDRLAHHLDRRIILNEWAANFEFEVFTPASIVSSPGGSWALEAASSPITRIPSGLQIGLPSCLDFAIGSFQLVSNVICDWSLPFSDHALLVFELNLKQTVVKRPKRNWNLLDFDQCVNDLGDLAFGTDESIVALTDKLIARQDVHECKLTCAQRRVQRMPFELRQFYKNAANACSDADRRMWQIRAKLRRKKWIADMRTERCIRKVRAGGVLNRSSKLHQVQGVILRSGHHISDLDECSTTVANFFSQKLGARDLHTRSVLKDIFSRHEGRAIDLSVDEVAAAIGAIRRSHRRNYDGACVHIFELLFLAQPERFSKWFSTALASYSKMAGIHIFGFAFGKVKSVTTLDDVRMIVPLTSFMQIADVVLARRLSEFIDSHFVPYPCFMECARPHTQVMDIVGAASLFIEKDLDLGSHGALAQADVRQHYDTLCLLRIFLWLVENGCDAAVASCALRHQLVPAILVSLGSTAAPIRDRSLGGLTGSRVAGQLGRIPVLASLHSLLDEFIDLCWTRAPVHLVASTFVDNVFFLGSSVYNATCMADLFEEVLRRDWKQSIKPSSKEVLPTFGNGEVIPHGPSWSVVESMVVLGHVVESNGAVNLDYASTARRMWASFYQNAGIARNRKMPLLYKLRLLSKSTLPHLVGHAVRWPFTKSRADLVDGLQRRMLSALLIVPAHDTDTSEEYVRRRNREVSKVQRSLGKWSQVWAKLQVGWHEHVSRERNSWSWAAQILTIRPPEELEERRIDFGRVRTRVHAGWTCSRWTECVQDAFKTVHAYT